jgi:hypothetical protein
MENVTAVHHYFKIHRNERFEGVIFFSTNRSVLC